MTDYQKMYYVNFNAITEAVELMDGLPKTQETERVLHILREAQCQSEEIYMMSTGENGERLSCQQEHSCAV